MNVRDGLMGLSLGCLVATLVFLALGDHKTADLLAAGGAFVLGLAEHRKLS